jgi:hypothetical protein
MKAMKHKLSHLMSFGLAVVLLVIVSSVFAAKGGGDDKDKKGYVLKVNGFEVKNTYLSPFSLMQQGATFKGNISPMQPSNASKNANRAIITYEKGNTIYIYPIQQKGFIHKMQTPSRIKL